MSLNYPMDTMALSATYNNLGVIYKNTGDKALVEHYQNRERDGQTISYFGGCSLLTERLYEKGKEIIRTFENGCPYKTIEKKENGIRIEELRYYKNSKIIAERSFFKKEGEEEKDFFL